MIDPELFWPWWEKICKRFNREPEQDMASDYLAYLDDHGLDTETAIAAAAQVWATREFFPRPADFLAAEPAAAWPVLLDMAKLGPHTPIERWQVLRDKISERAWLAIADLGGTTVIRDSRDLLRTRQAFTRSFEAVVIRRAQEIAVAAARREIAVPEDRQLEPGPRVTPVVSMGRGTRVHVEISGGGRGP